MTQASELRPYLRRAIVIGAHVALWSAAYVGAYLLRFDGAVPKQEVPVAFAAIGVLLLLRIASFWMSGLFHGMMRYAGIHEVRSIIRATSISSILFFGATMMVHPLRLPRSIYVGEWVLAILFASTLRLSFRLIRERQHTPKKSGARQALLLGAGDAGEMLLRDLVRLQRPDLKIVAILDDDPAKHDSWVHGVRVVGGIDERALRRASEDYDAKLAILAMPSASGARTRDIVSACRSLEIETKTLPSLHQILTANVNISMLRDVAIEDLLRREPVELEKRSMGVLLEGKRLLVTGGAGSIGSELARQALVFNPSVIALLDHNENALFFLERELKKAFPRADVRTIIGDVKDARRVRQVLQDVRPHVVLHAAAHKHVPLMEANPAEAIKNNVFGTRTVADLALAFGVETFVLVSTDKAVNPSSVMGATKRIAEMYVQSLSGGRTQFVAVRFGNVLGSAGSVVQVFREQIAGGGPVTVTHPDMRRYFMTIPEACQLVLQAGALARGGEIFLLDMGEPVSVLEMARDMIRMSGLEPDRDISIEIVGPRPGEKLCEELLLDAEAHERTVHPKILVGRIPATPREQLDEHFAALIRAMDESSPSEVRRVLAAIVPEAKLEEVERPSRDVTEALEGLRAMQTLA
jgi:FlaA1/EpsC-like NDP-sugar epimerase